MVTVRVMDSVSLTLTLTLNLRSTETLLRSGLELWLRAATRTGALW